MNRLSYLAAAVTTVGSIAASLPAYAISDTNTTMADTLFINGKVVTVDGSSSIVKAMAVKDDKFLSVGSEDAVMAYKGPDTKVIDLGGRTVIPGLTNSHMHAVGGGPGVDLSSARSLSELFAKVSEAAKAAQPGHVVVSNSNWHEAQLAEQRLPTAAELEAAAPGVPVVLVRGGHSYFLNDAALEKYGITSSTPVPEGGAIPQTPEGTLTGEVTDAAKALVELPPAAPMDLEKQQHVLNSHGYTSVRLAGTSIETYRKLQQLRDAAKLTVRYSVLPWARTPAQFENEVLPSGIKQGEGDEWVKIWGVKAVADGGFEGGFLSHPYHEPMGKNGTYRGLQLIPQQEFNDYMVQLNEAGWRVAVHAVGDAAIDEVLEGFEKADEANDISQDGWTIEHAFVSRPDQYPRMKTLGVKLTVQNHLYLAAPALKKYWGLVRAAPVTPLQTYLDEGFQPAGGTDSPVIPLNPFWVMYHFLTRDTISDGVYGSNQAVVSRDAMLRVMTLNYAKLTNEESIKGSIEPGKLADFVVLSNDYTSIPAVGIKNLQALATYVGGKQVYKSPSVDF